MKDAGMLIFWLAMSDHGSQFEKDPIKGKGMLKELTFLQCCNT